MFTLLSSDAVVGYSVWPWDRLYTPVVGCFVSGALVATAACDLEKMNLGAPPSMAFLARVRRRVMRELGRPVALPPPPMDGPSDRVWFRMAVAPKVAARLRAGDPAVRIERLEDGALVPAFHPAASPAAESRRGRAPVEVLLDAPEGDRPERLDGFAAFLTAPPLHQLEVAFFEYLRRLPETGARRGYLPRLESGEITVLDLRRFILESDEFKARRVGYGARLGAALTSGTWNRLKALPTLNDGHRPLKPFALAEWDGRPTSEFVAHAYDTLLGRPADPGGLAHYVHVSDTEGRRATAEQLSRWAACRGVFVEVI